jgi:hypothetical protein
VQDPAGIAVLREVKVLLPSVVQAVAPWVAGVLWASCGATDSGAPEGPSVVNTVPRDGDVEVDAELAALSVTFDESMGGGWSWVTETGHEAPDVTGFAFYVNELTNVLPVQLAPQTRYAIWVNSPDHAELRKFTNIEGVAARAYRIEFQTR